LVSTQKTSVSAAAVELKHISKRFGGLYANRDVDFVADARKIHAIVGENGAGKSTLMKILAGVLPCDSGEIWIGGTQIQQHNAKQAIHLGIGMVHQHFMLVESFTAAENIILGLEPTRRGLLDRQAAYRAVEEISQQYGLSVDPQAEILNMSVGERQRVEILKVLWRGAKILILDEPTAVLTPSEVKGLFAMLRRLAKDDKTILLITHKLDEVMTISDQVTVMRQGQRVTTLNTYDTEAKQLAHLMVGREVSLPKARNNNSDNAAPLVDAKPVLELRKVCLHSKDRPLLTDISFQIKAGEILGIAGVQGNGQSELLEIIAGLRYPNEGSIWLHGEDVTRYSVRDRLDRGLGHIPEDRHQRGLVLDFPIEQNLLLGRHREYSQLCSMDLKRVAQDGRELIAQFDIRCDQTDAISRTLSGGNQQKIIVARELTRRPSLLLAGQPTRGVDIGAIESIHQKIIAAKQLGVAILLVSAELSELFALSDKIAVIYNGRIVAIVEPDSTSPEQLGEIMLGAREDHVRA
jgi:simple sugar transport system ATP-binding protein